MIAIENVRLFNETQQALERQTATAEILQVIASSRDDVQPVLQAIVASAKRLLAGHSATLWRVQGGQLHLAALTSTSAEGEQALRSLGVVPLEYGYLTAPLHSGEPVQLADAQTDARLTERTGPCRSCAATTRMLNVPLIREGAAIGLLSVTRSEVGSFPAHQVELLQTFADQAVIAIQNARLFNETQEALEQQTASAEVLQVISSSVADTAPVFNAILDSCARLFSTQGQFITLVGEDGLLHLGAVQASAANGVSPEDLQRTKQQVQSLYPMPLPGTVWRRPCAPDACCASRTRPRRWCARRYSRAGTAHGRQLLDPAGTTDGGRTGHRLHRPDAPGRRWFQRERAACSRPSPTRP